MKGKLIKILSVLACLTLAVGFVSCGGDEGDTSNDGGNEQVRVTDGLEFTKNSEGTAYSVTGIGVYEDSEIIIPNEYGGLPVTSIGNGAFTNCDSVTSVEIPNSVTSIGDSAFSGCSNLEGVYITDIAAWCGILFGDYEANPLSCAKNLYVNNELVTNLVIPDTVTRIKSYAFYNCNSLTSVEVHDGVTLIGVYAFYNCDALTSVEIPDSVTSIGEKAFHGCDNLTSMHLGDGVEAIGLFAFYGCESLTNIYITDIAAWCEISGLSNLMSYGGSKNLYLNNELITRLEIPNTVTGIEPYAFRNCTDIASVIISDGVTSIGTRAFKGCDSITSVEIGDSVNSIGDYAFDGCTSLTITVFGEGVTSIGLAAFKDCDNLKGVFYEGTKEGWSNLAMASDNAPLKNSTIYFYSEEKNHYWHYGENGEIVVW